MNKFVMNLGNLSINCVGGKFRSCAIFSTEASLANLAIIVILKRLDIWTCLSTNLVWAIIE